MSIRFKLFGIPKTLDEFLSILERRPSKVEIWIEEKANCSGLIPETASYYKRIVLHSKSAEVRFPWKPAGGYYGTFPAAGYIEKVRREGAKAETARSKIEREIEKMASVLRGKGISVEIREESKIVFGLRKFI